METLAALLPLNTLTVSLAGLSTMSKTLVKHYLQRKKVTEKTNASMSTVEEVQSFCNNFIPAPFWVRVIRVVIPLSTRLEAGEILIEGLGDDDIDNVIGGREWWQRTGHRDNGVDAEWISMKRDWEGLAAQPGATRNNGKTKGAPEDDEELKAVQEQLKKMRHDAKVRAKRRRAEGKAQLEAETLGAKSERDRVPDHAQEATRVREELEQSRAATEDPAVQDTREGEDAYTSDLDDMPVMLAIHGGAYLLGSINTHRYVYWRLARKTGSRVFAVEYRLSPQFPFPCSLHDCLAAYLYLIRPPPGAKHRAVDPSKITICGDSAGGGMALGLMCLLRDAGLPLPAGAILISPWCDLTHSFPSILENTETDIPPPYGFGIFKPSTLWPPPPPEFRKRAAESTSLEGLKEASTTDPQAAAALNGDWASSDHPHLPKPFLQHHGLSHKKTSGAADAQSPDAGGSGLNDEKQQSGQYKAEIADVIKVKVDGKEVELADQIQLYATNAQLVYPFVSPLWQPSLGGLPPLYIMGGDKEVLRDEIIYLAHRAAHPDRYPVRRAILDQNLRRTARATEFPPTKVHLQIYDGICHDLPLFSFTGPAKYCYRAMASFAKWVTTPADRNVADGERNGSEPPSASAQPPRAASLRADETGPRSPTSESGSRTPGRRNSLPPIRDLDKTIYTSTQPFRRPEYVDHMIRERVSIDGVVRPMEPEDSMSMLHLEIEDLGVIKEAPVKRYLAGKAVLERRFKKTYKKVQKQREKHLRKSMQEEATRIARRSKEVKKQQSEASRNKASLPNGSGSSQRPEASTVTPDGPPRVTESPQPLDPDETRLHRVRSASVPIGSEGLTAPWSLDGENPPPSSLAGRKDTIEARKLAKVLDEHYSRFTALNIWANVHDAVTRGPLGRQSVPEDSPRNGSLEPPSTAR
ncbi:hypothetical protein JCM8202v2_000493 [Rhodotorula sphaerocarpa]